MSVSRRAGRRARVETRTGRARPLGAESARARRFGFTLIEVLLAIAIGASLLTAAIAFTLSMGELWGAGSQTRLFDQHVRGVSRFLESLVRQAEAPPPLSDGVLDDEQSQAETQEELTGQRPALGTVDDAPVIWQRPRGNDYGSDELLTFQLPESPGVLAWPEEPLPFVVCALRVDPRQGLFLLWKSRLELDFEDESPRELLVSRYVTGISYYYYDTAGADASWDVGDRPKIGDGGEPEVPQRIRLTFEYKGDTRTADVIIPSSKLGVPVY